MLAETGMPVEQYLRELDEHVTRIMGEGKAPDYPRSMTAAWMLSVSTVRQHLPEAIELLRCCAFFGQDPIPREVFRGSPVTQTALGDLIADPILFSRAVGELARFALVKIEDHQTLSVHRLIQRLLRDELPPEEQAKYQHEVHLILVAGAPADPRTAACGRDTAGWWRTWPHPRPSWRSVKIPTFANSLSISCVISLFPEISHRACRSPPASSSSGPRNQGRTIRLCSMPSGTVATRSGSWAGTPMPTRSSRRR